MGIDSNSNVAITINVVDNNSASVIQATEARLQQLGAAGTQAATGFRQVGAAGATVSSTLTDINNQLEWVKASSEEGRARMAAMFQAAQVGSEAASEGIGRMTGNLQMARLAGQEMGLRIPRAMYSIIGSNQALMIAIQALGGAFVALGAIGIFEQMAQGAYNLYEKWFDVTKEVDAYQQKVQQAAGQKLLDTASLEEATRLLDDASEAIDRLDAKRRAAGAEQNSSGIGQYLLSSGGVSGFGSGAAMVGAYGSNRFTTQDDQQLAQRLEEQQKASERVWSQQQQIDLERLKGQAAYDDAVDKGYAKIAAHERDAVAEIEKRYEIQQENESRAASQAGKPFDPSSGNQQKAAEIERAQKEAAAQRIALDRTTSDQEIQMRNAAIDAGLKGEALYQAQREQAIDAVTRKFREGEISKQLAKRETDDIDKKFDAEKMERLAQQERETQKIELAAQQAGLTGIAKLQAEGQNKIADIGADPSLDPAQRARRQAAAQQTTNADIEQAQREFYQQMADMSDRADSSQLQGYARIDAATEEHLAKISQEYQKTFGQLDPLVIGDLMQIVQGTAAMGAAVQGVLDNAARERTKLQQQTDEQITQLEAQAAFVPRFRPGRRHNRTSSIYTTSELPKRNSNSMPDLPTSRRSAETHDKSGTSMTVK